MNYGYRLAELRQSKNLSQQQLADILKVSQSYVGQWESGKRKIPSEKLVEIATLFEVSTDYLLGNTAPYWKLNNKEKLDIGKEVEKLMQGMLTNTEVNFYGEPMTEADKEKLKIAIQMAMEMNKQQAKKDFTPKKYRN